MSELELIVENSLVNDKVLFSDFIAFSKRIFFKIHPEITEEQYENTVALNETFDLDEKLIEEYKKELFI